MQRRQLAPDDLVALCFYVSPLDPVPDNTLGTQPSASFQPDPMAVYVQPPWTWEPPQPQPQPIQILNSTQIVQAETFERRHACYDELLKSNDLTFEQFHVLHPNAPHSTSWIDPQVPQSAGQPQLVYLSYCPQTVTLHQQPALQNIAVDSARTEVQSSEASAPEEASSKVAHVVEQKPEVEAPATDEDQLVANPVEKEVPVIPTRSFEEETLKELAFEEYNAIMDSIEIEEWHKEDYFLTELYKDDEMFLAYLDELCGDSSFVRNVGSELNMNYWESMLSSNADPFDLFAVENKSREEGNLQKTPPASDGGANVSSDEGPVTLAKSPKSDQNVSSDDNEASERLFQEILDAVASILSDSMNEAATTKEDADWANTQEPMTAPHTPTGRDVPTEGWDIIEWLLANIPQEQETLDDAPGGSPLLPTDRLELLQAIPDDYMTTFSTPFDESIYMGFHSPKQPGLDSTPMDPDLSSEEDLEALAEVWLKDSPEESQSDADSEGVQPKLGHTSPAPLCNLALRVFLNAEQPSFETARQESNSREGPAVSMQDALMVRSPVPCSGTLRSNCDEDICRNLESEMGDAAQNSKSEALEQEEELDGETLGQAQASDKVVSICKQDNVKRKDKTTVRMRWSRRLSSQICKLAAGDEALDNKQETILHFGHGDNEENSPKHRASEELDSIEKTKNRRKKREAKESSEHNEKTCFVQVPRSKSLGNGALKSAVMRVKAKVVKCPAKRSRQKAVKEKTVGISDLKKEKCQKKTSAKRRRQEAVEEIEKALANSSKKATTKHPSGDNDKQQSGMEKGKASSKRSGSVGQNGGTEEAKMATDQASSTDKAGKTHSSRSITRTSRERTEKYKEFGTCKLKANGKRSVRKR